MKEGFAVPDVIDNLKVGLLIKKLLKEQSMTQEDLAKLLNISKSAVSQNLNGKSSFDLQNLMKISEYFDISLNELLSQKSGTDKDVISEYERVVRKGIDELKRVPPQDLNVSEPDLYGKVLVEYVIEHDKTSMFKYLDSSKVELYSPFHHNTKNVILGIIEYMLRKNLDGIENYVNRYVEIFGSFEIAHEKRAREIMLLMNQPKYQQLVRTLMTKAVAKPVEVLRLFKFNRNLKVLAKSAWIELIAKYQLNVILETYVDIHKGIEESHQIVSACKRHNYPQGCHLYIDKVQSNDFSVFELRMANAQKTIELIAAFNDVTLFEKALNKGLYLDITKLTCKLITENRHDLYAVCFARNDVDIDMKQAMLAAINAGNDDVLKTYIDCLSQEEKNALIANTPVDACEVNAFLIAKGAKFATKHHNQYTFSKMNTLLQYLVKREGEKENA